MSPPAVAAVVVAYNGGRSLRDCVDSLIGQSVANLEIVVVDNASREGSIDDLERRHGHRIRIVRRPDNGGYARAANAGWRSAKSPLIAVLNQDLVLAPDCLERMRDALLSFGSEALVSPKLVLHSDPARVNAIGNNVHLSGVAWCNGLGTPTTAWSGTMEVTAVSGAAFLVRRTLLEALAGIEEAYFMYMEDVDLSLRARVLGATCLVACDAVAAHDWQLRLAPDRFGALERNRLAMWRRFWGSDRRMLPVLVQAEVMGWAFATAKGPSYVRAKIAAARAPLRLTPVEQAGVLVSRLSRRHPYEVLFPRKRVLQKAGEVVDRLVTAVVG